MTPGKPNILLIDDDLSYLKSMAEWLQLSDFNPIISQDPQNTRQLIEKHDIDLVLLDLKMPDMDGLTVLRGLADLIHTVPVIMISGEGDIKHAVNSLKMGAFDYIEKGEDTNTIVTTIQNALKKRASHLDFSQQADTSHGPQIIYKSSTMKSVMQMVMAVSKKNVNVLISGESGTGKELIARAIHYHSTRRDAPFIAVNCANFQGTLLESELFGYKKGAFTGAFQDKKGKIAAAHHGTLFFDEIGEIPLQLQAKLLRVLQEREVTPIGCTESQKIDFRLITATNRELQVMINDKSFRDDLFYRINTVNVYLPPLRQHIDDLEPLLHHFLAYFSHRHRSQPKSISNEAISLLKQYSWPGNIREFRSFVENLVIFSNDEFIDVNTLRAILNNAMRHHALLQIVNEKI